MERGCCGGCGSGGGAESGAEAGAPEASLVSAESVEAQAVLLVCEGLFLLLRFLLVLLPGIVGRAGEVVGEISEASVMVVSVGVGVVRSIVFLWGV